MRSYLFTPPSRNPGYWAQIISGAVFVVAGFLFQGEAAWLTQLICLLAWALDNCSLVS